MSGQNAFDRPQVSVVVPTFRRPLLVREAVCSALRQTFRDLEVIVVVDGLDRETIETLEAIQDQRLRVIVPPRSLGNAEARNAAIAAARADWVALLDDDDLWFDGKLEAQVPVALAQASRFPVVTCRFVARTESAEFIWPRRLPRPGQPLGDYIFRRRFPTTGDGVVQTSTILAPRQLFLSCPFDGSYSRYVDLDWLLRVAGVPGFELVFAGGERPLSVYRIDDRPRISNESGWRSDIAWARDHARQMSPEAYAAFILTLPSIRAARERDGPAFFRLLSEAKCNGNIRPAELAFHCGNFALPPDFRVWLARTTARLPSLRPTRETRRASA